VRDTMLTLAIIKPDAVHAGNAGRILAHLEGQGFTVRAARMVQLTTLQAEAFYAVHKERPFFASLTEYMCSGPILVSVLEGEAAISKNREIMGATDPAKAAPGTIRRDWGKDVEKNAVHGSDAPQTAQWEIVFFFKPDEIHSR